MRTARTTAAAFCAIMALGACAGDTRETGELAFRRDGWDVQNVLFTAQPAGVPTWCHVSNEHLSINVADVVGRATLPLRGTVAQVRCWNARDMVGEIVIERADAGRWPEVVEVRLAPDPRLAQASPGRASVAPWRSR